MIPWRIRRVDAISAIRVSEAFSVNDDELVHGDLPVMRLAAPALSDVAQDQPQQFGGGLIAGEVTPRFHRPAQLRVMLSMALVV